MVFASTRRIYLYWGLLLLSTLGIGVGAFWLLKREDSRLRERSLELEQARRTGLEARASQVVDNVELIVSDLQAVLLDTLASAPKKDAEGFLTGLERANPLVHGTFTCDPAGALLRPIPAPGDEAGLRFQRRFGEVLRRAAGTHFQAAPAPLVTTQERAPSPEPKAKALPEFSLGSQEDLSATGKHQAAVLESASKKEASKDAPVPVFSESIPAQEVEPEALAVNRYAQNVQRARRDVQNLAKIRPADPEPVKESDLPPAALSKSETKVADAGASRSSALRQKGGEEEEVISLDAFSVSSEPKASKKVANGKKRSWFGRAFSASSSSASSSSTPASSVYKTEVAQETSAPASLASSDEAVAASTGQPSSAATPPAKALGDLRVVEARLVPQEDPYTENKIAVNEGAGPSLVTAENQDASARAKDFAWQQGAPSRSPADAVEAPSAEVLALHDADSGRQDVDTSAALTEVPAFVAPPQERASPLQPRKTAVSPQDMVATPAAEALLPPGPEARGWIPVEQEGRLFVLGWYQAHPGSVVLGLELELVALVSRLGAALPPELGSGEGLCLRDERGRVFHQVGWVPSADLGVETDRVPGAPPSPLLRLPLDASLLPGWTVEAWLAPRPYESNADSGFLLMGFLLAAVLVVAILSGGSLLLLHARASSLDALQKTSFVANVSHELKTPLTTIRLYSELLEQGRVNGESKRAEYLRTIGRESERLSRLVANILDFSRLERGTRQLRLEDLDPAATLDAFCEQQAERLQAADMKWVRGALPAGLRIRADRDALGQVLLNLLDNAIKYASEGRELHLEAVVSGNVFRMRFCDRGPGIPAAERERIFGKFHRLDQRLTAEKGGAGLGLSIARQLARAMGGELGCENPTSGQGACFVLSLPLSPDKQGV